jgi:hypothetical protein
MHIPNAAMTDHRTGADNKPKYAPAGDLDAPPREALGHGAEAEARVNSEVRALEAHDPHGAELEGENLSARNLGVHDDQ